MRFRTVLLIAMVVVIAMVVGATVGGVAFVIDRAARRDVAAEIARTQRAFEDQQSYQQSLLDSKALVVTEEPRLKAVVATEGITHATLLDTSQELAKTSGADLFVVTDGNGQLIADVGTPDAAGGDLRGNAEVAAALESGQAAGYWIKGRRAYQVSAKRLAFGPTVVGVLVIGRELGNAVTDTIYRQTGSSIVISLGPTPIGVSVFEDMAAPIAIQQALPAFPTGQPGEVTIAGEDYLAIAAPFPEYSGKSELRYAVVRSLAAALAPGRALMRLILLIAAIGLIVAIALAIWVSRRLAQPLDQLVAFTKVIASGELESRVRAAGPRELQALGEAMNAMAKQLGDSRATALLSERLAREMEIASRIQTSILPRDLSVRQLEIAAQMIPASEVGGDYYDVLPTEHGCWIGIGDVAGHGLTAGLVMLMMQSVVAALVQRDPHGAPKDIVAQLNKVLFENIRHRLCQDEHVTMCLLRHDGGGKLTYAGAHEEIVVWRAATKRCELIQTPGTWLGAKQDVSNGTVDTELQLQPGDVMVLYTDGITEAANGKQIMFGDKELIAEIEKAAAQSVDQLRDAVMTAVKTWMVGEPVDDLTLVVVRYVG